MARHASGSPHVPINRGRPTRSPATRHPAGHRAHRGRRSRRPSDGRRADAEPLQGLAGPAPDPGIRHRLRNASVRIGARRHFYSRGCSRHPGRRRCRGSSPRSKARLSGPRRRPGWPGRWPGSRSRMEAAAKLAGPRPGPLRWSRRTAGRSSVSASTRDSAGGGDRSPVLAMRARTTRLKALSVVIRSVSVTAVEVRTHAARRRPVGWSTDSSRGSAPLFRRIAGPRGGPVWQSGAGGAVASVRPRGSAPRLSPTASSTGCHDRRPV